MGAIAVGATIYFGSQESNRQLKEIAEAFEEAHNLGMTTIIGVERLLGMFRTAVNVTGDLTACIVFNKFYGRDTVLNQNSDNKNIININQ